MPTRAWMCGAVVIAALSAGCTGRSPTARTAEAQAPAIQTAVCVLQPTEGNDVHGTVTFVLTDGKVHVHAEVTGLTPGKHGFHVHQYGDTRSLNGKSAGGHFNPRGTAHALPETKPRHLGDLGNLVADKSGKAVYDRTDDRLTLAGTESIIGRAIVVHAKPDDGGQPTGNAGARVAFGVIGIAKP